MSIYRRRNKKSISSPTVSTKAAPAAVNLAFNEPTVTGAVEITAFIVALGGGGSAPPTIQPMTTVPETVVGTGGAWLFDKSGGAWVAAIQTEVDGNGNWKASFPSPVSPGDIIYIPENGGLQLASLPGKVAPARQHIK